MTLLHPPQNPVTRQVHALRWGVIGTGAIANDFATALRHCNHSQIVNAVGSRPGRAEAFAAEYDLPQAADTLDDLLGDDTVDAVYLATPHPMHEAQTLAAIAAGKHVLCEKPITLDAAGAQRVIAAAHFEGVLLMEAYMYRCHPLIAKMLDLIRSGAIGKVKHIDADFGFKVRRKSQHRLFNPDLGGGAILDVGGYPASFARLVAGTAIGKDFDEPAAMQAAGKIGPTGVDEYAEARLTFASGITANLRAAIHRDLGTATTIIGELGSIHLPNPWIPQSDRQGLTSCLTLGRTGEADRVIAITTDTPTYAIEARVAADAIASGQSQPPAPAMTWPDTLGNMRLLDQWRAALHHASLRPGRPQ